jgi:transposase-like protein
MICTPAHCNGCIHYARSVGSCDYFHHTGQRRGCPAGKGCTRRETGRKKKSKDKEREQAYLLWQQGLHNAEIARRVGVSEAAVGVWRRKIWEVEA